MYSGSLTQRLRHFTSGRIQHRLIRDVFEMSQEERTVFENTFPGIMRIREIDWRYQNDLWVATRAVIPLATLEAKGRQLKYIGILVSDLWAIYYFLILNLIAAILNLPKSRRIIFTISELAQLPLMKERQFGLDVRYFILVEVLCS